ncbi:hypothetical protein F3Y22_tig00111095pilonHSYRG00382 [Hibiscus syriacus]|uniref:B box-type domain-containing protein n=1 Tax=Hibiscus syriacus TaxID=106335 RepID=A0A6A2Z2K0_HIBSY|nr:B-box zinc finger protein 32-like [Hibiscus syriacus]KAE8685639.1 hypothetical protein F3Y22_tig00111095pilonHSYRG00382 [Hibiscus syriacus]
MKTGSLCELCKEEASVYCWADSAFLCWNCDHKVHHANFLVARHVRCILCSKCKSVFQFDPLWGQSSHHLCNACSSERPTFFSPSPSSDSSSTSESSSNGVRPKKVRESSDSDANGFEGVFTVWCKKLGLKRNSVAATAASALRFCLERLKGLPFRLSVAAAFWFGLRSTRDTALTSRRNLWMIEELSSVPGKVIVAVEQRLARAMRLRKRIRPDFEEGWAESHV